jgi:hypothetical protein
MRQIDKGMELPATESYHTSPEFFTTLATENLKENISKKWETFVKAVMKILERFGEFLRRIVKKIKGRFKKKAGEENKYFEREGEGESTSEEGKAERMEVTKDYTLASCYVDMGNEANFRTFLRRMEYLIKLLHFVELAASKHGYITNAVIKAGDAIVENEVWDKIVGGKTQEVLDDFIEKLGAVVNGNEASVVISDTTRVVMPLENIASYPALEFDDSKMVTLTLPEDPQTLGRKLAERSDKILKATDSLIKTAKQTIDDGPDLKKVTNPVARAKLTELMPIYSKRMALFSRSLKMAQAAMDIADGIAADITGTKDEQLAKEAFIDYLDYLDLATESADKNKETMWKKMVDKLKWLYAKLADFIKKIKAKFRGNGEGKAGDNNSKFKQGESDDKSKGGEERVPLEFYDVSPTLIGWGDLFSDVSFLKLMENLPTILEMNDQFINRLNTKGFTEDAVNYDDEEWEIKLETVKKNMIDYFKSLPNSSSWDDGMWRVYISSNVYFEIDTNRILDYPSFIVEKVEQTKLVLPKDLKGYNEKLHGYVTTAQKAVEKTVILSSPDYNRVNDEKAKERLSDRKILLAFGNRAATTYKVCDFITDVLYFGRTMVADINQELKHQ